jgi:hypothetical protein
MVAVPVQAPSKRCLLVLGRPIGGSELCNRLHPPAGDRVEVHVLAPAYTRSILKFFASDIDEGVRMARERIAHSLGELGADGGIDADGEVGEPDPLMAIDSALVSFAADEIVIVPSADHGQVAEKDLFTQVCARFDLPVREIELREDGAGMHAVEVASRGFLAAG